ncbi:MAG: spermidine/putrescine ABC transporter substrate-binding protein [Leptolyngbyaceae cyanobacterium SM1_1_3]|nr:spermidine/putrescine ABC transporter substrate-binding protein [Leptolyngbyaceae cyanobacterium SM1_1_3]NJN01237.1 spermidine/putrescine ABC transporter substrate-binding protein [Leptolyngbyaceae cyanobacterium RM1_1_2]
MAGVALSNCRGGVSDVQSGSQAADSSSPTSSGSGTLNIYTWADYTDDELIQQFTDATGIEVSVDVYDSNETMLAKLQAGGGDTYSVIYPSDYMVTQMVELGLLTKLDQSQLSGLETMQEKWKNPVYDENNTHSVPFVWGTTGLIYNSAALSEAPEDWDYLWNNKDKLSRRITLLEDVRETLGAVLKSLGYSYNSTDPAELEAAYQKLLELKPALASFKSFGWQDELLGGDVLVSMVYSVEGVPVSQEDTDFKYVIPSSGSSVWTDTMVIPAAAPNAEAAYQWINFNLQPEVAASMAERLYLASPNEAVLDLLPEAILSDPSLFPSEELLARCEGIAPLGEVSALYDEYWTKVTSA